MINLIVDEAYAFDYLAILCVKSDLDESIANTKKKCEDILRSQLSDDLWKSIMSSDEFKYMIQINREVFDCVELARYGYITAKEVDSKNMERFYAKQKLQNKFFPNTDLLERKT